MDETVERFFSSSSNMEKHQESKRDEGNRNKTKQSTGVWAAAAAAAVAVAGVAWMSRQQTREETPIVKEQVRAVRHANSATGSQLGESEDGAFHSRGARSDESGDGGEPSQEVGDVDVDEGGDIDPAQLAEGAQDGGAVVKNQPHPSLVNRISSFASSAASVLSESASKSFKASYISSVARRMEGKSAQKRGGAASALAAGRGNISADALGPGASFSRNIQQEESLSVAELKIDSLCSRLVHDVYEDDHERWPLGGFEIADCRHQEGSRLTPKWVVLVHRPLNVVAVTFRGTFSVADAVADLVCVPLPLPCGVKVHAGMQASMVACEEEIRAALTAAMQTLTRPRLILTGHSYGGGVALLLRLHAVVDPEWQDIVKQTASIEAVTFGAPLVFGKGKVKDDTNAPNKSNHSRIAMANDDERAAGAAQPCTTHPNNSPTPPPSSSSSPPASHSQTHGPDHPPPPPPPNAASLSPLSPLNLLHRSCRCYVHAGDVVPRLLGPRSADVYDSLVAVRMTDAKREQIRNVVAAYEPVGSHRFIYTATAADVHHIRVAMEMAEAQHLLEPFPLIFVGNGIQDHSTLLYSCKIEAVLQALLSPQS